MRRASGESGAWRACWETRHYLVVAMVGVQRLARLLRARAAGNTADHAAAAMPRRPWCVRSRLEWQQWCLWLRQTGEQDDRARRGRSMFAGWSGTGGVALSNGRRRGG